MALAQERSLLVTLGLITMCLDLRITLSVRLALLGHIVQMVRLLNQQFHQFLARRVHIILTGMLVTY